MHFLEFDNNFQNPPGIDVSILDTLPIKKHHYGGFIEANPTELYWLEYQQAGGGNISFVRKLYLQYPDVAEYLVNYIRQSFPKLELYKERVNILKTVGSIVPHVDESNRMCSINIGVKNSKGAITKMSSTRVRSEYESTVKTYQCQDGHGYLIDTSCFHEVIAVNQEPRYLFTYGFGRDFNTIMSYYQKSN
jgi:hypothetical protein